jgi:hypothetical protein
VVLAVAFPPNCGNKISATFSEFRCLTECDSKWIRQVQLAGVEPAATSGSGPDLDMGGGGPDFFNLTATTNPTFVTYANNAGQPS